MKRLFAIGLGLAACVGPMSTGCSSFDGGTGALVATESDLDLIRTVQARLRQDPMTQHASVVVRARNGTVTLSGSILGEPARMRVLSLVRGTAGVVQVEDNIRVTSAPPGYRPVRMP